jgi:hypothetical protein
MIQHTIRSRIPASAKGTARIPAADNLAGALVFALAQHHAHQLRHWLSMTVRK